MNIFSSFKYVYYDIIFLWFVYLNIFHENIDFVTKLLVILLKKKNLTGLIIQNNLS